MNDKIKLFNEQAIKYAQESLNNIAIVNKSGIMYNYNDLYTEKFAELIVEECIQVLTDTGYPNAHGNCVGVEEIKQHFGVEE
jgi:isocitrate dehydrogenase